MVASLLYSHIAERWGRKERLSSKEGLKVKLREFGNLSKEPEQDLISNTCKIVKFI